MVFLDYFFGFFSGIGIFKFFWITTISGVLGALSRRNLRILPVFFISIIILYIGSEIGLKNLFAEVRPCNEADVVQILRHAPFQNPSFYCPRDFSFPSGHAVFSFAIATVFALFDSHRLRKYTYFLVAFFVAVSRVYLGVHYIHDVIAGATIGVLVVLIVNIGVTKYLAKRHS